MKAETELDIHAIAMACQGNMNNLPTFMVHDNSTWTAPDSIIPDTRGRIHIRRAAFARWL